MQNIVRSISIAVLIIGQSSLSCTQPSFRQLSSEHVRAYADSYAKVARQDRWIGRGCALGAVSAACVAFALLLHYATAHDDYAQMSDISQEKMNESFRKAQALFCEQWLAQQNRSMLKITYDIFVGNFKYIIGMSLAISCSVYAREACNSIINRIGSWWDDGVRSGMYTAFAKVNGNISLLETFTDGMAPSTNNVDRAFCTKQATMVYSDLIGALERSLGLLCISSKAGEKQWLCNEKNGLFCAVKALSVSLANYTKNHTDENQASVRRALMSLRDIFGKTLHLHMSQEVADV